MTLVWSLFTTVIVLAYSSNLRANLISKVYEKPIRTHQDVLDRGTDIYIPQEVQVIK